MGKLIMAIDPGANGGIAVLDEGGGIVSVDKMPSTMMDLYDYLSKFGYDASPDGSGCQVVCYLEAVGFGIPGQSSKATATFSRHCGHVEMALLALRIPTNTVTPQKWIKSYQLGKSNAYSKTEWKNRLKAKAQQLFPMLGKKITLATCDALLIAEYGRKIEIGK